MSLRVACIVNFLFPIFLGLLRKSIQKKKQTNNISQNGNRKEGDLWRIELETANKY